MWTLALETTTAQGSVALLREGEILAQAALEGRDTAAAVFRAVEAVLRTGGRRLADMDLFAAADGPGSFTGVRVGLTAIKGFCEVLGKPAAAISTLRAVAEAGAGTARLGDTPVLAALDASRGEVYFGVYGGAERDQEGLESLAEFEQRLTEWNGRAFTPYAALAARVARLQTVGTLLAPAVGRLAVSAFRAGRTQSPLELDARYLRRADAEMARPA